MDRREFLQCAAILVTGASASQLGFTLNAQQQAYLAAAPNYNAGKARYFSASQRAIVAAMTEVIIPRTETPGAIDAGVPNYVELMVADWLNDTERAIFDAGLADIETRVPQEYGKSFDRLSPAQQLAVMEALEDAAAESAWYDFGNVQRQFISDAPFICQLKELTIWGFFTSEVGSKQVLRYNAMPMYFDGDIPLSPDDSSWASGPMG
ncbi:MAG: gluconate 2-dehydrogenase subunit 3 family protein [Halioglobus sp.]|nr:gluconate 2-dehydrogenase subunit 3 family protein [Halioglobus sp.]